MIAGNLPRTRKTPGHPPRCTCARCKPVTRNPADDERDHEEAGAYQCDRCADYFATPLHHTGHGEYFCDYCFEEASLINDCKEQPVHINPRTGAVRSDDAGRGAFEMISPHGLLRLAKRYEAGAIQKGNRNWEKGIYGGEARCLRSAMRHANQILMGDKSEDHWAAIAWQAFTAMHYQEEVRAGRMSDEFLWDKAKDLPFHPDQQIHPDQQK